MVLQVLTTLGVSVALYLIGRHFLTDQIAALLLAPLLFLPLRKPSILLVGSLTFIAVCLFAGIETKSIGRQYQVALVPVL